MARLDAARLDRHRRRNRLETLAIFVGILAWLAVVGWLVLGWLGLAWAVFTGAAMLWFQPVRSVTLLKAMYGAQALAPRDAPGLYGLVEDLVARAGMDRAPELLYIPRPDVVALSTASGDEAAVAVSDGLLRRLPPREVAAVLAHEMAHLRHGDLKLLRLADAAGRLTRTLSLVGLLLAVFYFPAALSVGAALSPWPLILLVAAPVIHDLMTLKLSRSREFDADAGGAELTGDPQGLILALRRIDNLQSGGWERLTRLPGWRWLSWIRTHPSTDERIRRLDELVPALEPMWLRVADALLIPGLTVVPASPRWRRARWF